MKQYIIWLSATGNFIKNKNEIGSMYFMRATFSKLTVTLEITIWCAG